MKLILGSGVENVAVLRLYEIVLITKEHIGRNTKEHDKNHLPMSLNCLETELNIEEELTCFWEAITLNERLGGLRTTAISFNNGRNEQTRRWQSIGVYDYRLQTNTREQSYLAGTH